MSFLEYEGIEVIDTVSTNDKSLLTTVIGIKSNDGIVLASDSQISSGDLKNLEGTKLFRINDYVALGCAGDIAEAQMFIEELSIRLTNELLDRKQLRKLVEAVLLQFYKEYAVDWSKKLKLGSIVNFYNPVSLLSARLPQNKFGLYVLKFSPKPSMAEVPIFEAIGSGDKLANLMLRQYSRGLQGMTNKRFSDLPINLGVVFSTLTINEIKGLDRDSGGNTKVIKVDYNGVTYVTDDDLLDLYNKFIDFMSSGYNQMSGGKVNIEAIRTIFPPMSRS
jgi:20S proteasome alpha/beta subunit